MIAGVFGELLATGGIARQLVTERLMEVTPRMPEGIIPVLGPVSTGLGEVYQYTLDHPDDGKRALTPEELTERRTIQDWVARPLLRSIPGVAEINSQGGYVKQYQVEVDPGRLRHYGLSVRHVVQAIADNNANASGGILPQVTEQYLIRAVGLVQSLDDIGNIVLKQEGGVPVFVRDVAEYKSNFAAQADGKKVMAFFPSWNPNTWEIRHLIIALKTLSPAPETPVATTYNSIAPFKLGEHNIKYRVIPQPEACPEYQLPEQNQDLPNFLRNALYQQLSLDRVPACFALQVQRQNAEYYMPIEDPSVEWSEAISPFETVATIKVPAQDFDSREQNLFCDNLSFNPWHALPEHRPIGGINRLRKAVYEAVSIYRLERNQP